MSYLQPLLTLVLLLLAAAAWSCRSGKSDRCPRLLVLAIFALFFLTWRPVSWLVSRPFEAGYAHAALPSGDAQAIVVLSANVLPPLPERPVPLADHATYERCQYAAWLNKNWRDLPVLACGGVGPNGGEPYSITMRRILEGEGVATSKIWTEEKSRSTQENAVFGAEILRRQGVRKVALVTEAYHMPRAVRCFRKQGVEVIPAPCGFRRFELRLSYFLPGWKAIEENELTLHEAVGMAWYRVRGWN